MKAILFFVVSFSVTSFADPQKLLCDAIQDRSVAKMLEEILNGASLSKPCADTYPLHLAVRYFPSLVEDLLRIGVEENAIDSNGKTPMKLAQDKEDKMLMMMLLRQSFANAQTISEVLDQDTEEGFILLGSKSTAKLPPYILEEKKHQAGWLLWGERIFDIAEEKIGAPSDMFGRQKSDYERLLALTRRTSQMLNQWGKIPPVDWGALDKMDNTDALRANLTLLQRKREFIVNLAFVLQQIKNLDDKYEGADLEDMDHLSGPKEASVFSKNLSTQIAQAVSDQGEIKRYINYLRDELSKREHPKTSSALYKAAQILGVNRLPSLYEDAIKHFVAQDSAYEEMFIGLCTQVAAANARLDDAPLREMQDAVNESVQRIIQRTARLAQARLQFYSTAAIALTRALQMSASLLNSQFATDSFPNLIPSSNGDHKLERAQNAEERLKRLVAFDLRSPSRELTTDELATLYELGPNGLSSLQTQVRAALKLAPNWSSPDESLGTLLHSGWRGQSTPTSSKPAILKAMRTLGMGRGQNIVVDSVILDFSELGVITKEQAVALLAFVQTLLDRSRDTPEEVYAKMLAKSFEDKSKETIIATSTAFVSRFNEVLFQLHTRLRERAGR